MKYNFHYSMANVKINNCYFLFLLRYYHDQCEWLYHAHMCYMHTQMDKSFAMEKIAVLPTIRSDVLE